MDDSTEGHIGKVLHVRTSYGWGWSNPDSSDVSPLPAFDMQLRSIWHFGGVRRGGVAIIRQEGHPANGLWVVFSTRHVARYNFKEHLGEYNIQIGEGEPVPNDQGWPIFSGRGLHDGYGQVSAAEECPS